jgi:hypothetical protein
MTWLAPTGAAPVCQVAASENVNGPAPAFFHRTSLAIVGSTSTTRVAQFVWLVVCMYSLVTQNDPGSAGSSEVAL